MSNSQNTYGLTVSAINSIIAIFQQYPNIQKVWLYGSRAKGNYRLGSDIDLCLEGENLTISELLQIENQLDDLLLPWKIDLSLRHFINNPSLLQHIEEFGILFFSAQTLL